MFLSAKPILQTSSTENISPKWAGSFNLNVSIVFNIVDTDFEETIDTWAAVDAIITAYERRNLDVAKALIRFFSKDPYFQYSAKEQRSHSLYGEKYSKYADDVETYLMLA